MTSNIEGRLPDGAASSSMARPKTNTDATACYIVDSENEIRT